MDRERILQHFDQELERLTAAIVLDKVTDASETGQQQLTDFLDPFSQRTADKVLHFFRRELKHISWGGYAGAERARILIYPAVKQLAASHIPLAFVEAIPGAAAAGLTHRDFLGSLLALGLRREKIGDIMISETQHAAVVLHPEILSYVLANWQHAGNNRLAVREITADELTPPVTRSRDIKTTVASLRLDAVASSGFGISRSKLTPAIRAGHVKLNWQAVKSAGAAVKVGDIISVAGRGRVEVAEILGESKKGRIQLVLKKHV